MSPDDSVKLPRIETDAYVIACSVQGVIGSLQMVHGLRQRGGAQSSLDIDLGMQRCCSTTGMACQTAL